MMTMKGECGNCGQYSEQLTFWITGTKVCPVCRKEWKEKHNKIYRELAKEANKGDLFKFEDDNNSIENEDDKKKSDVPKKKKDIVDWFS